MSGLLAKTIANRDETQLRSYSEGISVPSLSGAPASAQARFPWGRVITPSNLTGGFVKTLAFDVMVVLAFILMASSKPVWSVILFVIAFVYWVLACGGLEEYPDD